MESTVNIGAPRGVEFVVAGIRMQATGETEITLKQPGFDESHRGVELTIRGLSLTGASAIRINQRFVLTPTATQELTK